MESKDSLNTLCKALKDHSDELLELYRSQSTLKDLVSQVEKINQFFSSATISRSFIGEDMPIFEQMCEHMKFCLKVPIGDALDVLQKLIDQQEALASDIEAQTLYFPKR